MEQVKKVDHYRVWLQGVVSIMLILTLLSVGSPPAEAISDPISAPPESTGVTSAQANNSRDSCTSKTLIAVADSRILASQPTEKYGEDDTITIDANNASPHGGLFRWDLKDIPADATIQSASLSFNVTGGSNHIFGLYHLKRNWVESEVTWNSYDGVNAWGTPGAANTSTDRGEMDLWITDSNSFSTVGVVTIQMNSAGVSIVQEWVNGQLLNHGLTIQNYQEAESSRWTLTSRENSSPDKPTLNIHYCSPSLTPTVTVTANPGQSKVYGEVDPTFSYTASESIDFTGALGRAAGENVGTYAIEKGTLAADGYEIVFVSTDFTITQRLIEVIADNLTKVKGSADPDLTYQITAGNLVGDDSFIGALEREPGEDVGEYNITQGSLAVSDGFGGNNYLLTFIPGTLTITDSQLPPELPHAFYGDILYSEDDDQPDEHDQVLAYVDGVVSPVGTGNISSSDNKWVYNIKVQADDPNTSIKDGAVTGDTITFLINERIVANNPWQGGASTSLDFHPPFASTGGPYLGLIDELITFNGVAQDMGGDILSYAWDLTGNGQHNDSTSLTPTFTYATEGTHPISLLVTDEQGGQGTDSTDVVIMKLEGLSQAYDGTAKYVTVIGVDDSYTYTVTYNDSTTEPVDVGDYNVEVTVFNASGTAIGTVSAEMTITSNEIIITAHAKTKVYGEGDPELTYTMTGELAPNDSISGALTRQAGESVGSYTILQGSLTAGSNYVINYTPAQLTITHRPITVKANDHIILEGDVDPTLTYEVTAGSLAFDDSFTGALARESGDVVGFYAIEKGTLSINNGSGDQNYTLTFIPGTMVITTIQEIELTTGWNLISFSLQPLSTSIQDVLNSIQGKYTIVYAWDATKSTNNWSKYDPSGPEYSQTLKNIDQTQGFWIYMSSAATLSIQGTYEESTTINLSVIGGGWNLVGFPSSEGVALPGALEGKGFEAGSDYLVFAYVASEATDPWKVYDSTAPSYGNDLKSMTPGLGYWIYVNTDVTWEIVY